MILALLFTLAAIAAFFAVVWAAHKIGEQHE